MSDFNRKVTLQVHDEFPPKVEIAEVVQFIREQKVPGELRISLSGNGGITSVVFHGKPVIHTGAVKVS